MKNDCLEEAQIARKELRFLPRRYRVRVDNLLAEAWGRGRVEGVTLGVAQEKSDAKHNRENLRTEVCMTIQRLGDANAQIASSLANMLGKL